MMEHSADAWEHNIFKEAITRAKLDIVYKAIEFYLLEQPKKVIDLIQAVVSRVDHAVVVERVRRKNHLPVIKPYLLQVQEANIAAVNQALNELYIEEGEYDNLRKSIVAFDNFDHVALAQTIENHPLLEFRRIAANLFVLNKQFEKGITLCKKDNMFKDAIAAAAQSESQEIAEDLLTFFVRTNNKAGYTSCLYTCYELIRPDLALEFGWRNNLMEFTYPFLIQSYRHQTEKVNSLESRLSKLEANEKSREEKEQSGSGFDKPIQPDLAGPYGNRNVATTVNITGVPALPMAPSLMVPPGMAGAVPMMPMPLGTSGFSGIQPLPM